MTHESETSVRDWTWTSAKIYCTDEQPWWDRLKTIIGNSECEPCVMTFVILTGHIYLLTHKSQEHFSMSDDWLKYISGWGKENFSKTNAREQISKEPIYDFYYTPKKLVLL